MASQAPERDQDVVTYSQFNGLRSDVSPERFGLEDLAISTNCDIDKSGRIARRNGYTLRSATATHSLWADSLQEYCLFVRASTLRRLAADYTSSVLQTLLDGYAPVSYERVSDRVYFGNGRDMGIVENGAARSWGLPQAPLPGVTAIAGEMPAGIYQFAMTWLRSDGQESGAAPLAGVIELPAGSGVRFTVPVSPLPEVVGKILYISPANGEVMFTAAQLANSTQTYDFTADPSRLEYELTTQAMGPPPAGHLISHYRGYMLVAVGDTVYVSQPYRYELFDLRDYFQPDGRVTMMAPMNDKDRTDDARASGFFIGTERSCGILSGATPKDFQYVIKTDYGAIPGAIDYVDGSLFGDNSAGARPLPVWLTTQGLCVGMPDLNINNLTRTKFTFPAAGRGAALFMPGPNRFIATANI